MNDPLQWLRDQADYYFGSVRPSDYDVGDKYKQVAYEIERLRKRVSDLENLAHEAENILGELDADDGPLDIGDWRCWYRELGLLQKGNSDG